VTPRASTADITRRAAVGGLAAAGLGFALFGPRGQKERSDGRLVLDYWEKWTGHEGRAMQKVVADFNESQSRIFVRYLAVNSIDQKTMIATAGGAPPDIVGLWNYNIPGYALSNAILPLDDLARPFGVRLENYAMGVRPVMTFGGRLYGTVNTGGTLALYYNKGLLREAGLDPERPPRTISELDGCQRRLTIVEPGGAIRRTGFLHREPGWWSWLWGYYFGASLYDERANLALVDSPINIQAFDWVQSYPRQFDPAQLETFRSGFGNYDSPLNGFLTGKVAMVMQGPWLANVIGAYGKDIDYGVCPFPVHESLYQESAPIGMIDTDVLVIPRGVRHPEASMEFIAYTQRQDVVEYLATVHCKNSPLAVSSESFLTNHPNRGVRVHDAIAKSPRSFRVPDTRAWLQFKMNFDIALDTIWTLKATPKKVLTDLQVQNQVLLNRVADQQQRRDAKRGVST